MKRSVLAVLAACLFTLSVYMTPSSSAPGICERWRDYTYARWPDGHETFIAWDGPEYEVGPGCGGGDVGDYDPGDSFGWGGYDGGVGEMLKPDEAAQFLCDNCKINRESSRIDNIADRTQCYRDAVKEAHEYCNGVWGKWSFAEMSYDHCTIFAQVTQICTGIRVMDLNPDYDRCYRETLNGQGTRTSTTSITGGVGYTGGGGPTLGLDYSDETVTVNVGPDFGLNDFCFTEASKRFGDYNVEFKACRDRARKTAEDLGSEYVCR